MPVIRESEVEVVEEEEVQVGVKGEIERRFSGESKLLASAKIDAFSKNKEFVMNPITPRTDFAMRQANHLVERICRDNGVEAPKYSFSKCPAGQEDLIVSMSSTKHASVLRLAEYLHKRGQIERDYALALQKLNRQLIQTGDTDERLGQLIVMGEKTAAGHLDWARKISEQRIVEDLKALCNENEEHRKSMLGELKKYRGIWSKAVGAFEKFRKNRDKAQKVADSAQLAFDSAMARGNCGKGTLARLKEEAQQKAQKAKQAREEYNRAMSALTARQGEIFNDKIPQCLEGLEKMERARMAAVRASLINLAQVHLAVADVEIESGQRWLKSLVSLSVDDEIEIFIRSVEERAEGLRPLEVIEGESDNEEQEEQEVGLEESHDEKEGLVKSEDQKMLYENTALTNSEADLLKALPEIEEISDPRVLQERRDKLEKIQIKLEHQIEALERMESAYSESEGSSGNTNTNNNKATLEAIRASKDGIAQEIEENSLILEQINQKLSQLSQRKQRSGIFKVKNPNSTSSNSSDNNNNNDNPMISILEELNRLDQRRVNNQQQPHASNLNTGKKLSEQTKKKALSRSFEELLKGGPGEIESLASPKATGLKLPGAQWTVESIKKSNEEISINSSRIGDYFCAADEEGEEEMSEARIEEIVLNQRRDFRNRLSSVDSQSNSEDYNYNNNYYDNQANTQNNQSYQLSPSGRRKSIGQTTRNEEASTDSLGSSTKIPKNRVELFKVQALYNFIGRKETDELDLSTGEILGVYEASGEWWEAENEAGIRGYIPFNYVIKI